VTRGVERSETTRITAGDGPKHASMVIKYTRKAAQKRRAVATLEKWETPTEWQTHVNKNGGRILRRNH
jgi:hypothetical protein